VKKEPPKKLNGKKGKVEWDFIHKPYEEWGEENWCVCGCWLIQALKLVVEGNCFHT
jgi:hypothetical protein